MSSQKCTLLLTLWGREKITPFFVKYFEKYATENLELYIADGSITPQYSPDSFHGSIKYHYFGYDSHFHDYILKIKNSLERIQSKYVLLIDNDDLFIPKGVDECVSFLECHPDYFSAQGKPYYLRYLNEFNPDGNYFFCHNDQDYSGSNEENEVSDRLMKVRSLWNTVIARDGLLEIFNLLDCAKFDHLHIYEDVFGILATCYGKSKIIKGIPMYIRNCQRINSSSAILENYDRKNKIQIDYEKKLNPHILKLIHKADINCKIPYDRIEALLNNIWHHKFSLLEIPAKNNINVSVETRFKFVPDKIIIIKRSIQYFWNRQIFKFSGIRPAINFLQNNPKYFGSLML
jgi:glycosyltransferase domain-containing protein